jgi:hypothetical protein
MDLFKSLDANVTNAIDWVKEQLKSKKVIIDRGLFNREIRLDKYEHNDPVELFLTSDITNIYLRPYQWYPSKGEKRDTVLKFNKSEEFLNHVNRKKFYIIDSKPLSINLAFQNKTTFINFDTMEHIQQLTISEKITLAENTVIPRCLKRILFLPDSISVDRDRVEHIDYIKFLENNDLTDVTIGIQGPTLNLINNIPNNVTKLMVSHLKHPLTNLPPGLEYIKIYLYDSKLSVLPHCRFPLGCKVVFFDGDMDYSGKFLKKVKSFNLTYPYEFEEYDEDIHQSCLNLDIFDTF